MKNKYVLLLICLSGFLAVAFGAFGAHALMPLLTEHQHMIYEKAVSYQFYHTLVAMIAYVFYEVKHVRFLLSASIFFLIGIACFSGSLYLIATSSLTGFPLDVAGPITPAGGLFLLGGWGTMMFAVFRYSQLSDN